MSNDFLYWFGFYVEYRLLCLARGLAAFTRWFVRVLGALLTAVLRPVALGCIQLRQALRRPKAWLGLVVPVAGVLAFAWLVRTWLGQPFALRVEVNGTVVGYVASEQDFDTARADVQARVNTARALLEAAGADVPDWDLDPAFTLAVSADTMTPGEVANAILQASGSEITAGTAVYVDGALRFVTTEGDHLRTLLAAVRRPYMDPADADSRVVFAHELTLADGIYLTGSVSPYTEVVSALQANDGELLRVQIRRRERYEQELAYDTQIVEDDTLDFGKSETVQPGQPRVGCSPHCRAGAGGHPPGHPVAKRDDRQAGHRQFHLARARLPAHFPLGELYSRNQLSPWRGHCRTLRHRNLRRRRRNRGGMYPPLELGQLREDRPRQRVQNAVRPHVGPGGARRRRGGAGAGHRLCGQYRQLLREPLPF